ncbi:adenosylcobinamide-GDP ribazoletransferase [Seohaeicola zhoushanensis]|uniref:Adenosylcobinamide-GDP ribazoletransferase n=1 Tax=Seohaeicola zhoushanensis TaxID=1569283 RepID=A0A8J3GWY8_9RHOB|nr:adenosylcobinamide-GDP ribazoletransferase [Seohaeicola zhoushanensis]GHF51116.1 adenosylcobinamide-GDP ribazoletransferase [Seohaeicola zhoushanensis]
MSETDSPARRIALDPLVALALLTRLPLPRLPESAFAQQARAAWAFPLAGLAVGALAALAGLAALRLGLPAGIAAGLALAAQVMLSGAMHEDGLADVADGFWGGFDRARRLEIMKDSAIGSYGVLALILSLGLRWSALSLLLPQDPAALIAAACLSRATLPALMTALPPARAGGLSRGVGVPGWTVSAAALALGLGLAYALTGPAALAALLTTALLLTAFAALARAKIGGQTGDVLGASQQLGEIAVLLTLLAL